MTQLASEVGAAVPRLPSRTIRHAGRTRLSVGAALLLPLLHVPLALLMCRAPAVGAIHAWTTLAIGVSLALSGASSSRVAGVAAYIVGAEVLWRMTGTPIFWEFGKYATILILALSIRHVSFRDRGGLPFLYLALLVPATLVTIMSPEYDLSIVRLRKVLSFNLSGPLATAVCIVFFSRIRVTETQLHRILFSLLAPIFGVVTVIMFQISLIEDLTFHNDSMFETSGGFGPNQVSSILGFAALISFVTAVRCWHFKRFGIKWVLLALSAVFAGYSALTFSRSGLYMALGSGLVGVLFMLRDARSRSNLFVAVCLVSLLGVYLVGPQLSEFTGGMVSKRFSDANLSHRGALMDGDMQVWREHPFFGVGAGMSQAYRQLATGWGAAAHTEFSRLLAEHGVPGMLAMGVLFVLGWQSVMRKRSRADRAFAATMCTFVLLYLMANAMRLVLPSFAFGMACLSLKKRK